MADGKIVSAPVFAVIGYIPGDNGSAANGGSPASRSGAGSPVGRGGMSGAGSPNNAQSSSPPRKYGVLLVKGLVMIPMCYIH